jgi:low temperature requirement protein LtrA
VSTTHPDEARDAPVRVTTLELFFDLVFVFTITQLTAVLHEEPNGRGLIQVMLMLVVIWWMYGGYVWLTNAVTAQTASRRLVLLGGMAGYFVLALSVQDAFHGSGLAFGLSYVVVVTVHSILFTRATSASAARAILTLAPLNLTAAALIVAGGALGGDAQYVLWAAAGLFEWLSPQLRKPSGFTIAAGHFVERHGLVVIVAIGESVIAVGLGAARLPVDASLLAVASVGLAVSASLWWLYFSGDDQEAERALIALSPPQRAFAALRAFGYWHLPLLFGIVAIAAAEREATAHPFDALSWWGAAILGGGAAAYLIGDAFFRRELGIGSGLTRITVAALAVMSVPLGATTSAFAQLAAVVLLLVAVIAADSRRSVQK